MNFVLLDCNNFYVSCERLFNPKLERCPVIVLSSNDGCVVSRSKEAKELGIGMGEPFFKIRDFCRQHKVFVHSSNYQLYGDISQRVMQILEKVSPEIEIYSIDEAFMQYPEKMDADELFSHCVEVRRMIRQWVGIPTSLGIAPTKTLAKAASRCAKKDPLQGVFDLSSLKVQEEVLKTFPVADLWGVGHASKTRLHAMGIYTAGQFRKQDPLFIRRQMGVIGERMVLELQGVSCLQMEEAQSKKSITCSRSFGRAVTDQEELAESLSTHVFNACTDLREQKSCAQALCVYLKADGQYQSTTISFPVPVNDTPQLISAAKNGLRQLFREKVRYKKCGIILLDLLPESSVIPDLFLGGPDPKRQRLSQMVDALNATLRKKALFYAAMGVHSEKNRRCENRSPRYTTCWDELPVVKADLLRDVRVFLTENCT